MFEELTIVAARVLPSVIIFFFGIVAFKAGLRRFGRSLKIQLRLVLVLLWIFGTLTGFLFGTAVVQIFPVFALPVFFIGVFYWLVSLFFSSKRKKTN